MTTITTKVNATSEPSIYDVLWRINNAQIKHLSVDIVGDCVDGAIISELAALHHLLMVREVAGNNRSGNGINLQCQHGAIKKLCRGRSGKKSLIQYAQFLRSRFVDANISVVKHALNEDVPPSNTESIILDGPLEDILHTDQLGCINIRHHVIERYMERTGAKSKTNAWRNIKRILTSGALTQIIEPDKVKHKAKLKHGKESQLWVYKQWGLRLIKDTYCMRLVTVIPYKHI
ncbi:MAG: hypothetical protein QNL62_05505 [Gammaproteobacteria bacterium]|nr:hypothetical protein [Gammaproteobacteria bacterium]